MAMEPVSPLTFGQQASSVKGQRLPDGGFTRALTQAKNQAQNSQAAPAIQPSTGGFGARTRDEVDEADAMRELFHLMACLYVGIIDTNALGKHENTTGIPPGPKREQVEALKRCLREFLARKSDEEDELDPTTEAGDDKKADDSKASQAKPQKIEREPLSLREAWEQLPDELKNLLRRVFPDIEGKLREDEKRTKKIERT